MVFMTDNKFIICVEDSRCIISVRLSTRRTGCLYHPHPPGSFPGVHFCYRLCRPQTHRAAGSIVNRIRDFPARRAATQTPDPLLAPIWNVDRIYNVTFTSLPQELLSAKSDENTAFCSVNVRASREKWPQHICNLRYGRLHLQVRELV